MNPRNRPIQDRPVAVARRLPGPRRAAVRMITAVPWTTLFAAVVCIVVVSGIAAPMPVFALVPQAPVISDIPDQTIEENKSTGPISFTITDRDSPATSLTASAAADNTTLVPRAGIQVAQGRTGWTITVTPAANQRGRATITVTASDGRLQATKTFLLTVNAANTAPTISNIPDLFIPAGGSTGPLSFTVGDAEISGGQLTVRATSDNSNLVPASAISLGGTTAKRTITVTPAAGQIGTAAISVTVSDGLLDATDSFRITVFAYDFGDAPDPGYPTLFASNGARHRRNPEIFLGQRIDAEPEGQPNAGATGDDLSPTTADDEDGVIFVEPVTIGTTAQVGVRASIPGRLWAWIDFNIDGDWSDPGEMVFDGTNLVTGANALNFVVPATAKEGSTFSRFRFTRGAIESFLGEAPDGEVEDHPVRLAAGTQVALDFGDAPDTYRTKLASDGARHTRQQGFNLGKLIDVEPDGQASPNAQGDDLVTPAAGGDDEDGVVLPTSFTAGQAAVISVDATAAGRLDAWLDANGDGDFADAGERVLTAAAVAAGSTILSINVPAEARAGQTFLRFRFSRQGVQDFFGPAPDGEVEDYQITVVATELKLDFGDAPDPTYPTTLKNNGARHRINPDVFLGLRVDAETDGQPNAGATGDDAAPSGAADDEDGVTFVLPLAAGQNAQVDVRASTQGRLWAWVDFNADGDWSDAGEQIFTDQVLAAGVNSLNFVVPAGAKAGPSFSRFRFTRATIQTFTGDAPDGEVEDHPVRITAGETRFDYGDAPEENTAFPTTIARKGAHHQIEQGFHLGQLEDVEPDGQPNGDATGDDAITPAALDDEDGVQFLTPLIAGGSAKVQVTASARGRLDVWIDFDLNRSWNDPGEKIFNAEQLVAGVNVLSFNVPATARGGVTFTRFRFSQQGGLPVEGFGGVGEVEDHTVRLDRPTPCELGCNGTDFWLTFPGNYAPDPANPVKPQLCILGAPGVQVTVRIAALNFNNVVNIPASGAVNISLPKEADLGDANDVIEDKGIHVTATGLITIHALSQVKFTSDGYTVLSTEVLGTEYIILGYGNLHTAVPELNGTQFALVGTEDKTSVTITPTVVTGTHDSGFPYVIQLNAGQTYQLRNTNDAPRDLTGTIIQSDKPIAAFGGHQIANVQSQNTFFADYLVEELLPVNRWGTDFFARPLAIPTPPGSRISYTVRVLAAQDQTRVFVDGVLVATINRGESLDRLLAGAAQITTDRPASMTQYAHSSDSDGVVNSDPFMVLGQQRNLFNRDLRFCTAPSGFLTHHINVIVPTASVPTVQLDGAAFPGAFAAIGLSGYSHGTAQIIAGVHRVTASQPAGVIVYGWNEYESYAWPACQFFGDTTPPELTCPQDQITVVAGAPGTAANLPCGAVVPDLRSQVQARDNCGLVSSTVGVAVQQTPAPGTTVGVGTHDIVLSVVDAQGNVGTCIVKFIVTDPNPDGPLTLRCPDDLVVPCTQTNGAIVNYNVAAFRGCTPVAVQCVPPPGSLFPIGTTTVNCTLDDPNNPMTCSFTVTVRCNNNDGPRININLSASNPVLTWTGTAVLESATSIQGPWTPVEGALPPFNVVPEGSRRFFRIRQ